MNNPQKIVLIVWCLLVFFVLLFPPIARANLIYLFTSRAASNIDGILLIMHIGLVSAPCAIAYLIIDIFKQDQYT